MALLTGMVATTQAANISWSAKHLTGAGQVSKNGKFLEGLNFSGGSNANSYNTTINGVTFKGFTNGKNNNNQFPNPSAKHFRSNSNGVVASGADWYTTGGGGLSVYDKLLSRTLWGSGSKVTLANLIVGDRYEVQLFFGDTRNNDNLHILIDQGTGRQFGNSTLTRFRSASNPSDNGLAITGTFTATGTTQSFTVRNPGDSGNPFRMNGYQLRKLNSAPAGKTYHVAPNGNNNNPGTQNKPFRNIYKAAALMKAGETCLIHAGTYYEKIQQNGLKGTASKPITFKPYGNGRVIVDGTAGIAGIKNGNWKRVTHNGVSMYKIKLKQDIWQLLDGGKEMTLGRWPNASFTDGKLWNRDQWAWSSSNSTNGNLRTDTSNGRPNLAAQGKSFNGGWIVHNAGQWNTRISNNYSHNAGSGNITYPRWGNYRGDANKHRYFLTAHLNCVDVAGEWHYNKGSKELFYKTSGGGVPSGNVRGRIRRWGFDLHDCSHVKIQGIEFVGCSIEITASSNFLLEDCKFKYYNYQKRVLGSGEWSTPHFAGPRTTIRNCEFTYADGRGINFQSADNSVVENVLLHDVDWTGGGSSTFHVNGSRNVRVTRFTMYNTGASEGLHMGAANITELCRVGPDVGTHQVDGAPIHYHPWAHNGSITRYNWTLDHDKRGARADVNNGDNSGGGGFQGSNLLMHHMVATNCQDGGLSLAGNNQRIFNNTSFNNKRPDIYLIQRGTYLHQNTQTRNNATDPRGISNKGNRFTGSIPPPGITSNNWDASNVRDKLVDPSNLDFRPVKGSPLIDRGRNISGITNGFRGSAPDIGAYEYGDNNYWIPGFQTAQASTPIPRNNATNQPGYRDLMWLGGWKGTSYDIYFGTNRSNVANAGRNSPFYRGRQSNNIYRPNWVKNKACYWRIDTVIPGGRIVKGQVWKLTYGNQLGVNNWVSNSSSNSNSSTSSLNATNSNNNSSGSVTQNSSGSSSSGSGGVGISGSGAGVRVTEYHLSTGDFSGKTATLTLNRNLANDYYILVRGSRTGNNLSEPDSDYARVTAVPGGKGDLPSSGAANQIVLSRYVADFDWEGVVTVVECDNSASAAGFRLIDVAETALTGTSGTDTVASWTNRSRVVLFGGYRGGGAALTQATSSKNQGSSVYTRLYPSGSGTLNWTRQAAGEKLLNAVMTTFVVEWGSEWNVQHVNVAGAKGGEGANATSEYTTRAINAVKRDNTWVWATGTRTDAGIGDCAEACLITLGNGVNQNTTESAVAVGSEYTDAYNFDVYVMTHSAIAVDHRFKADGHGSGLDVAVAVDQAPAGARFGWVYNGVNGTGDSHPRSRLWARYTANGTVTISRGFNGQNFPAWVQAINFSGLNR